MTFGGYGPILVFAFLAGAALEYRRLIVVPNGGASVADSTAPAIDEANGLVRNQASCFVPNLGQWPHAAQFVQRAGPMTVFVEEAGWVLDMQRAPTDSGDQPRRLRGRASVAVRGVVQGGVAVRFSFFGARTGTVFLGESQVATRENYFLGDKRRWRTNVPCYSSVRARGLYTGIDVRLCRRGGHLKYDVVCDAGADLGQIAILVEGAERLSLGASGSLTIDTALGTIQQPAPTTWEELPDGTRRNVECEYVLLGPKCFGFAVSSWRRTADLVIDPQLIWSTFLGGSAFERAAAVAVNPISEAAEPTIITVAGWSASRNFPTSLGAYDRTYNSGGSDVFVTGLQSSVKVRVVRSTSVRASWST